MQEKVPRRKATMLPSSTCRCVRARVGQPPHLGPPEIGGEIVNRQAIEQVEITNKYALARYGA